MTNTLEILSSNSDHVDLSTRDKVNLLESQMKEAEQVELDVNHYFSPGVYARELFISKGVMLTGKIHKYQQLNIMTKGEMLVLVGDEIKHVKAPFVIVSPAGTKRIAEALEDTIWITVHGTDETDVEKIEHKFIAQDEAEYLEFKKLLLGNQNV